jgi:hypothetical protein
MSKRIFEHMNQFIKSYARKSFFAAATAAILGASLCCGIARAAEDDADTSATVVTPIAITNTAALAFGKFTAGSGGTVVMSAAGVRSKTSGVVLLTGSAGGVSSFNVTGDANATYAITLPAAPALVTHTDTETTMSVGTFTNAAAAGTLGTLSGLGAQTIRVGGTLTVANAQLAGVYSGTFAVAVEYN